MSLSGLTRQRQSQNQNQDDAFGGAPARRRDGAAGLDRDVVDVESAGAAGAGVRVPALRRDLHAPRGQADGGTPPLVANLGEERRATEGGDPSLTPSTPSRSLGQRRGVALSWKHGPPASTFGSAHAMIGGWLLLGTWLSLWSFLHAEPFGILPLPDLAGPAASVTISRAAATDGASQVTIAKLFFTSEGNLSERETYAEGALEYRYRYRYDERGRLRERTWHDLDGSVRERRVTSYLGDRVWRHE